jgi:hypothetical protein
MKPRNVTRILLVSKLVAPSKTFGDYPDVLIATVATLDDETQTPRNWTMPYREDRIKNDTGGFTLRTFKSYTDGKLLTILKARRVASDSPEDYTETANALKTVYKRLDKANSELGYAQEGADTLARYISALGVSRVFMRPEETRSEEWLSKGEWVKLTPGNFVNLLRRTFES